MKGSKKSEVEKSQIQKDDDDNQSLVAVSMRSNNKKVVREDKQVEEHPVIAGLREGSIVSDHDNRSKKSLRSNKSNKSNRSVGSKVNQSLKSGGKTL